MAVSTVLTPTQFDCHVNALMSPWRPHLMCVRGPNITELTQATLGSFSNDNGDGNENVTNLHIQ